MKIRVLIILVSLFLFQSIVASAQKEKKSDDKNQTTLQNTTEGVVYALPRTGLSIRIKVEKESFRPGPYSLYAEKYLGYSNVKVSASDTWKIVGVAVECFAEADPGAVYRTLGPISSMVSLLPDGTLAGINSSAEHVDEGLRGSDLIDNSELPEIVFPDQSSDDQYDTQIITETGEEKILIKSNELKAREAADYLFRLRKKRAFTILDPSDGVPEDGKGYEVFIQQVEKLDREYVSLFLGKCFKSEHEFTFNYFPGNDNVKSEVLCRFSDEKGILNKTDVSGRPITIDMIKDQKYYAAIENIALQNSQNQSKSGLYYRIPVNSTITLSEGFNTLYSGRAAVAQFGLVVPVPEILIGEGCSLSFDPITGSLKSANKK